MMNKRSFDKTAWKMAVPLAITEPTHDDAYWQDMIRRLKKMGAHRVFLTCFSNQKAAPVEFFQKVAERIDEVSGWMQKAGIEAGIWLGHTIGHGGCGSSLDGEDSGQGFTQIVGGHMESETVTGETGSFCPMDERFQDYICQVVAALASTKPALLMLDDDFRLGYHLSQVGCFCHLHLAEISRRIGRPITGEELLKQMKTDFELRRVWCEVNGESLANLAEKMEKAVHTVSPNTRFGTCTGTLGFASDGISQGKLTKIMTGQGGNRPFVRACYAPYWAKIPYETGWNIEAERLQNALIHRECPTAEVMAEGDTYPHSTFAASAASLEAFHEGLETAGFETVLSYQFNYGDPQSTDWAFPDIITRNRRFHEMLREQSPVDWTEIGFEPAVSYKGFLSYDGELSSWEASTNMAVAAVKLFPRLGLPIAYENDSMPVALFSEDINAFSDKELTAFLKRGAVIDGSAAEILLKRGYDIGVSNLNRTDAIPAVEYCDGIGYCLRSGGHNVYWSYTPAKNAVLRTTFDDGIPGVSFIDLKKKGKLVFLPWNVRNGEFWFNLLFCTQKALQDGFQFLCGIPLPAKLANRPDVRLHCRISPDGAEMALSVQNISLDDFPLNQLQISPAWTPVSGLLPGKLTPRPFSSLPKTALHPFQMAVIRLKKK